jgi:hypothetical protein
MMPLHRPPTTTRRAFNLLHFEFINVAEAESRITGLGVDSTFSLWPFASQH